MARSWINKILSIIIIRVKWGNLFESQTELPSNQMPLSQNLPLKSPSKPAAMCRCLMSAVCSAAISVARVSRSAANWFYTSTVTTYSYSLDTTVLSIWTDWLTEWFSAIFFTHGTRETTVTQRNCDSSSESSKRYM